MVIPIKRWIMLYKKVEKKTQKVRTFSYTFHATTEDEARHIAWEWCNSRDNKHYSYYPFELGEIDDKPEREEHD